MILLDGYLFKKNVDCRVAWWPWLSKNCCPMYISEKKSRQSHAFNQETRATWVRSSSTLIQGRHWLEYYPISPSRRLQWNVPNVHLRSFLMAQSIGIITKLSFDDISHRCFSTPGGRYKPRIRSFIQLRQLNQYAVADDHEFWIYYQKSHAWN